MKKRIFLTVDTECHSIKKLNNYITGKTNTGVYGLERILELGKELNIPVNVFLDVPECHVYGDEYMTSLVELIQKYGQPIFLHVHPDYIADPNRKHLWEYSKDEQKVILKQAILDYQRYCGNTEKLIFRAGAWGVNNDTYEILNELQAEMELKEIIDLSYVYKSRWRCRLSFNEYGAANASKKYHGITLLPNTTYIGFDYLGKDYAFELCVPNKSFNEFKQIINQNKLRNITYTMHSWDFIKRWFFLPNYIKGNDRQIRLFKKCVAYARAHGYEFCDLREYRLVEERDQCINLCKGIRGKLWCLWYNYLRFSDNGRSYKKYAPLYFSPAIMIIICVLVFCYGKY